MTKRDILKFLERKYNEKLSEIRGEYDALHRQLMQNAYSDLGLPELAGQIQPLLEEASRLWAEWVKEHETLDYVSLNHGYYTLSGLLDRCTVSDAATFDRIIEDDIKVKPKETQNAYDNYKIHKECVNNTFNTVITTVQDMKNAKQAAVYLKELGFDLSEIGKPAEQIQMALMVPVDTRFLFVKAA